MSLPKKSLPLEPLFITARNIEIHQVPKTKSFQNHLYSSFRIPKESNLQANPINHQTTNSLIFLFKKYQNKHAKSKNHMFSTYCSIQYPLHCIHPKYLSSFYSSTLINLNTLPFNVFLLNKSIPSRNQIQTNSFNIICLRHIT